jgi:hypothetical protein
LLAETNHSSLGKHIYITITVETPDELAQGYLKTGAICCIIRKIKETIMDCEPYPDEMFEIAERREKSNRVLQRYNDFYNLECSGLPHGTPITPEQQQIIAFQSMIDALRCENLNREYNEIAIADIEDLMEALYQQSISFLERVKKFKDSAEGVA